MTRICFSGERIGYGEVHSISIDEPPTTIIPRLNEMVIFPVDGTTDWLCEVISIKHILARGIVDVELLFLKPAQEDK